MQLLRRGSEDFRAGFAPVTITPRSGPPIQGMKKNEDLFSVQIMDTSERIQGFEKEPGDLGRERDAIGDADRGERGVGETDRPLPDGEKIVGLVANTNR